MAGKSKKVERVALESLVDGEEDLLEEMLALSMTLRPIVTRLPPNPRLVLCNVGGHQNVRVMVHPNNKNYKPGMEIPLDIHEKGFDPAALLEFKGTPPRRRGVW